jgi:hypothetical protein
VIRSHLSPSTFKFSLGLLECDSKATIDPFDVHMIILKLCIHIVL